MRIIFAGSPTPAAEILHQILQHPDIEVVGVLTQPDRRRGRRTGLTPTPVAEVAESAGIPVYKYPSLRTEEAHQQIQYWVEEGVQLCVVVAYGLIIPTDLLNTFPYGWLNVHYSLLPRWRGASPVQSAIAAGDSHTGVSIFRIGEGLDTGPLATMDGTPSVTQVPIQAQDTSADLLSSLTHHGAELMIKVLEALPQGKVSWQEQPQEGITHSTKISVADAEIDWNRSSSEIDFRIRAYTPAPGSWTVMGEQRIKIFPVTPHRSLSGDPQLERELSSLAPGEIYGTKKAVYVGTADGAVVLGDVQAPGKKRMAAVDWVRGLGSKNISMLFGAVKG